MVFKTFVLSMFEWACLLILSSASSERPHVAEGYDPSKDLSARDIDDIAKKLGLDWERLAIFLDYEEGQKDNLKYIYKDQV